MNFSTSPIAAATERLSSKTPVGSALRTAEWSQFQLALRDRAFFTAGVEDVRTVALLQDGIRQALDHSGGQYMSKPQFVATLRTKLGAAPGDSGELTDLTSRRRLELIYDFNVQDAREYARFVTGNDPAALDAYPAQELIREQYRIEPRDWAEIWASKGGTFYGTRMIARKDDPIWTAISRFGRPWPPFDFGSGMGLENIDRDEAESLGLLTPDDQVSPPLVEFNKNLQATLPKATPALMESFKALFGDQVDVGRDGKVTWQGQRVLRTYEEALRNPNAKWDLALGSATATAVALAPELEGAQLLLKASELKHIYDNHMVEDPDGSQRPVTPIDLQLIPHVWRAPDAILPGDIPGTLEFRAQIAGWKTLITFNRANFSGVEKPGTAWGVRSFWAKKEGVKP